MRCYPVDGSFDTLEIQAVTYERLLEVATPSWSSARPTGRPAPAPSGSSAAHTDAARTDAVRTDAARTDAARTGAARTDAPGTDAPYWACPVSAEHWA